MNSGHATTASFPNAAPFSFRGWLFALLVLLFPLVDAWGAFDSVVEHGPSSNRVNAFFLGDGYTSADIAAGTYSTHVQNYVNYMFANAIRQPNRQA